MGHMIPALTIAKYFAHNNEVVFLHSMEGFVLRKRHNIKCVYIESIKSDDLIDKNSIQRYHDIIEEIQPDITISDWSLSFQIAATLKKVGCNITILRAELIIGYEVINYQLNQFLSRQSLRSIKGIIDEFGLPVGKDVRELMTGDITIIPGIPEIDVIPDKLPNVYDKKCIEFIGPLFTNISVDLGKDKIKKWIQDQKYVRNRKLIFMSLGTAKDESLRLYVNVLKNVRKVNASFIIIVSNEKHREKILKHIELDDNFLILSFTNLGDILEHVDLALHHCGHGLLYQCLYHGVPSITFPTGHYDREDNAVRLEKLGVNRRFASSLETFNIEFLIKEVLNNEKMKEAAMLYKTKIRNHLNTRGIKFLEEKIIDLLNEIQTEDSNYTAGVR